MSVRFAVMREPELRRTVSDGALVERIVLERIAGSWSVYWFLEGYSGALAAGAARGGLRHWVRFDTVMAFVRKMAPATPLAKYRVVLLDSGEPGDCLELRYSQ